MGLLTKEECRKRLKDALSACAAEIETHGVDALWDDSEYITGGNIIISIDDNILPSMKFIRKVFPAKVKR